MPASDNARFVHLHRDRTCILEMQLMKATLVDLDHTTIAQRRQRLREAIAKMATAIAAGECTPTRDELEAVAALCTEYFLPIELARVRRWMSP